MTTNQGADTSPAAGALPRPKYDVLSPDHFADPYPVLHRMRAEDPVYFHPLLNAWLLTRYDDIAAIARDRRFSAQRTDMFARGAPPEVASEVAVIERFISHWMWLSDPPRHTLRRNLVGKAFTPAVIDGLLPFIETIVDETLDVVEPRGEMDALKDLALPLPAIVIAKMLGIPNKDIASFKGWVDELMVILGAGVATAESVRVAHHGVTSLDQYFRTQIAWRREHPGDDLLTRMLEVEEQGTTLTEEEIAAASTLLLGAGHESTTHLIGNAMLALLRNPGELEKLRAHPELMEGAVEELLRYDCAVKLLSRRALSDVEIGGHVIRAGDFVFGMIDAGNRNPAHFSDPDRLDVTRKDVKSLSFGQGAHYCIGAALARMETQVVLDKTLRRLGDMRVSGSVEWLPNIMFRGLVALPLTFTPRGTALDAPPRSMRDVSIPPSLRRPSIIPPSVPPSVTFF